MIREDPVRRGKWRSCHLPESAELDGWTGNKFSHAFHMLAIPPPPKQSLPIQPTPTEPLSDPSFRASVSCIVRNRPRSVPHVHLYPCSAPATLSGCQVRHNVVFRILGLPRMQHCILAPGPPLRRACHVLILRPPPMDLLPTHSCERCLDRRCI